MRLYPAFKARHYGIIMYRHGVVIIPGIAARQYARHRYPEIPRRIEDKPVPHLQPLDGEAQVPYHILLVRVRAGDIDDKARLMVAYYPGDALFKAIQILIIPRQVAKPYIEVALRLEERPEFDKP